MKRKPFYNLLLQGFGYIVLGNFLCLFMTMALTMFATNLDFYGSEVVFNVLAILCGTLIFFMLMFTVAWKDGARERSLVKNHRVEAPLPRRWIWLGLIMFAIAALPSVVLLLNKLFFPQADTFLVYRFVSGSAYPFIQTFVPVPELADKAWVATDFRQIDIMSPLFPALMILYYAVIPAVTQFGWYVGYTDKFNTEKLIYK